MCSLQLGTEAVRECRSFRLLAIAPPCLLRSAVAVTLVQEVIQLLENMGANKCWKKLKKLWPCITLAKNHHKQLNKLKSYS